MDHCEINLQQLVEKGKTQGFLTYQEVTSFLPDEATNPEELDRLIVALESHGIALHETRHG